jgi:hypothetical protein
MTHHTEITILFGVLLSLIGLIVFAVGLGEARVSFSAKLKLYIAWVAAVVILSLGYR